MQKYEWSIESFLSFYDYLQHTLKQYKLMVLNEVVLKVTGAFQRFGALMYVNGGIH